MTDPDQPSPGQLVVEALGVRVAADLAATRFAPETLAAIRAGWSRAVVPDDREGTADVHVSPVVLTAQPTPDRLAATLSTAITLAAIDARAGQLVLLHAAGVADPATGATVALVGPSGRGKTTASLTLARHWGYVSDETIGVDPGTLTVWPHPKPLSVKGSENGSAKTQVGPDESGLLTAPADCHLSRIVLLERDPDHQGSPEVSEVAVPRAVGELTAELSHLRCWEAPLASVAGLLTATGGALRVRYCDATALPPLLDEFVTRQSRSTRWWPVPTTADAPASESPDSELPDSELPDGQWQRTVAAEAIADDDTLTVLLADGDATRVIVLDGIGPTIWHAAARPCTAADLVEAVVEQHGTPPSGSAELLVNDALGSLQGQGILRSGAP